MVCLLQRLDHIMGGGEIHRVPLLDCFQRQSNGQMGFAHARRTQEDQIFLMLHEPQGGQIPNPPFINGGLEGKIELIQRLMERQMCHTSLHPDKPFPFGRKLLLQQLVQKLQIRYIVLGSFFSLGMEHFRNPAPTKLLKSVLEAFLQNHCRIISSWSNCSYTDKSRSATSGVA